MPLFRSNTPAFLDFKSRRGNSPDRENALRETSGDPAKFKLNHVMLTNESMRAFRTILQTHGHGIEYAKMYSGLFEERRKDLPAFVQASRKAGVIPYVGGGATEAALRDGRLASYVRSLHAADIDTIEVSNTYGDLSACDCVGHINRLSRDFNRVLVEIGSKTGAGYTTLDAWRRDLDAALDADADAIILEGAGSGRTGIYNNRAMPNGLLMTDLMDRAGARSDRFLVEAPFQHQREYWANEFLGWSGRFGNISLNPSELDNTDRLRLDLMQPGADTTVAANRTLQRVFFNAVMELSRELTKDPNAAIFNGSIHGVQGNMLTAESDWREKLRTHLQAAGFSGPTVIRVVTAMSIMDLMRMMFGADPGSNDED